MHRDAPAAAEKPIRFDHARMVRFLIAAQSLMENMVDTQNNSGTNFPDITSQPKRPIQETRILLTPQCCQRNIEELKEVHQAKIDLLGGTHSQNKKLWSTQ